MTWQRRVRDILLAGGTVSAVACASSSNSDGPSGGPPCGNANPDPCICGRPEQSPQAAALCDQQKACVAAGGIFDATTCVNCAPDGGVLGPHCDRPITDAGSDDGAARD